eukprot:jgi/Tetstr1/424780/TSEL_001477.t1
MNRPFVTLSANRHIYVLIDEPNVVAPWAASLRSRLQDAFGSDELEQRTLDLLSSSLIAQTLKSNAGRLSQFAEFCHDSENISPLGRPLLLSSAPLLGATGMDYDDFGADEEDKEQVGPGGGSVDRAVRGNNEGTEDNDEKHEDEDENEDGGDENEGDHEDESAVAADIGMSHFTVPAATVNMPNLRF